MMGVSNPFITTKVLNVKDIMHTKHPININMYLKNTNNQGFFCIIALLFIFTATFQTMNTPNIIKDCLYHCIKRYTQNHTRNTSNIPCS